MIEREESWLRILMEDILRLSKEKKEPPTVEDVMQDSKVRKDDVKKAIKGLKKKNLAKMEGNKIILTSDGEKAAQVIYNYHKTVEALFGHKVAHSFEHLGEDKIQLLKRSIGEAKPLEDFMKNEEGEIISLEVENPKILSRLIGVGITPGNMFKVIKLRKDVIILDITHRLVLVDRKLADKIFGRNENSGSFSRPA